MNFLSAELPKVRPRLQYLVVPALRIRYARKRYLPMVRFTFLFFTVAMLCTFSGCPADLEMAPAIITVDDLLFDNGQVPGGTTADITEVWAFNGEVFIGAFPLPARIPVLASGPTEIRLEAGVRQNGISSTPEFYEFYTPIVRTFELVPGEVIELGSPVMTYRDDAQFAFVEDFELGRERVFSLAMGTRGIAPQEEVVLTGEFSGVIELNEDNREVILSTRTLFTDLLETRPYVWLEIDFRSDVPVRFGVSGNQGGQAVRRFDPGFFPRSDWTKIYFNLSETIFRSGLENYRFDINAVLPEGMTEGNVYLDNMKLLYF